MADDKTAKPELDPVRILVMAKLREHRMTMKELSQAIGRNDAYMQQYLKKRSPLVLPTGVAELVGQILHIPVGLLVGDAQREKLAANLRVLPGLLRPVGDGAGGAGGQAIAGRSTASAEQLVPVYRCPGPMGDGFVTDWVERPGHYAGAGACFAVWVPESCGRLRAGDLLFVRPGQPVAPGDIAALLDGERIEAIGELRDLGGGNATLLLAAGERQIQMSQQQLMRGAAVVFR